MATVIPDPPPEFIEIIGGGPFHEVGGHLFQLIRDRAGVKPSDAVLDVGSGCGRIAVPLTRFLDTGTYDGIEIIEMMVDWCRRYITGAFPNFRFHHAALANTAYSPTGGSAAFYTFPFPNDSFDVVFATSVFTHLLPDAAAQYAREIARTLKPDGKALLTFLLLNERSVRNKHFAFVHRSEGYAYVDEQAPERVLAFDEADARTLLSSAGLRIEQLSYGQWAGNDGWTFQDALLLGKSHRRPREETPRAGIPMDPSHSQAPLPLTAQQQSERADQELRHLIEVIDSREQHLLAAKKELSRVLKELEDRDSRLRSADEELRRLLEAIDEREQRLVAADREFRHLLSGVEDRDRRLLVADGELRRLLQELGDRDRRLIAADGELRRLQAQLEERDRRISTIEVEREQLAAQFAIAETRLGAIEERLWRRVGRRVRSLVRTLSPIKRQGH